MAEMQPVPTSDPKELARAQRWAARQVVFAHQHPDFIDDPEGDQLHALTLYAFVCDSIASEIGKEPREVFFEGIRLTGFSEEQATAMTDETFDETDETGVSKFDQLRDDYRYLRPGDPGYETGKDARSRPYHIFTLGKYVADVKQKRQRAS